jgi:hypothetical protein
MKPIGNMLVQSEHSVVDSAVCTVSRVRAVYLSAPEFKEVFETALSDTCSEVSRVNVVIMKLSKEYRT